MIVSLDGSSASLMDGSLCGWLSFAGDLAAKGERR